MSDYADLTAVRLALSPGGDETDSGSAASLQDGDLQAALDDATNEVNAKIGAAYTTPVVPAPAILARITRDIAAYFAMLTYRRGDPPDVRDPVQLRYDAAEALLTQVQNGTVVLPVGPIGGAEATPMFIDPTRQATTLLDGYNGPISLPQVAGFYGQREGEIDSGWPALLGFEE